MSNWLFNDGKGIINISGGNFTALGYYYALNNYGYASLTGGYFATKDNRNSIISQSGSTLKKTGNVIMTGKIDYV